MPDYAVSFRRSAEKDLRRLDATSANLGTSEKIPLLPVTRRLPIDLPDKFRQVHFQRGSEGVNDDDRRVADAAFKMIDHRATDAGESRQLALGNPAFLADFLERSNECAGKLL